MKINEVITEAGIINTLAQQAAGIGGFVTGGTSGYTAAVAQKQGQQQLAKDVNAVFQKWNAYSGQTTETDPRNWTAKYFRTTPDKLPEGPTNTSPGTVKQWLTQVEQYYQTGKLQVAGHQPQSQQATQAQQPAQTQQQSAQTQQPAQTQQQPAQVIAQQPAQTQQQSSQATPSAETKIFTDPATFKAEWDKYVASKSATAPYQLIADPALLSVLKDMWMRTGGTKVESKKNKGRAI